MAIGEQFCEAEPQATGDLGSVACGAGEKQLVDVEIAANGHAPNGDVGGEDFGELDDLETVDMTGGGLMKHMPETQVNGPCDPDDTLHCDAMALDPNMLPEEVEQRSSHLSASATPDKAREIEGITERLVVINENVSMLNVRLPT